MGGIISRCSFVGGHYALTASEVTDVHLEGNTYWVNSCGVALLNAERCSIHNERINSQGTGIEVALKARDLRISGCLICGPRGVVLAEPEDSDRELFDVHVCENRIEASTCGIRIGNKSNSSFLLERIQISDNTVMGGDECCIHVVAGDTRAWGAAANVKITNNRIQGDRIGLYLIGYGLDVIGNHVALDNPQPTQYEDNKPAGILLKSVECAFVKDNCVIVANCVTDDASAVRLISGFAARLIGNWLCTLSTQMVTSECFAVKIRVSLARRRPSHASLWGRTTSRSTRIRSPVTSISLIPGLGPSRPIVSMITTDRRT
jgi:nitrous oxidase accessory protein NosD